MSLGTILLIDRPLVVAALGKVRNHALRVEDAFLVHHEAALDAGRLLDERRAGLGQRLQFALGDGLGVLVVVLAHEGIEALHQLVVGDAVGRSIKTGSADDGFMHSCSSSLAGPPSNGAD